MQSYRGPFTMNDQGAPSSSGARADTATERMYRLAIILAVLAVVFDLAANNASCLKAIVALANALMWRIGPI